MIGWDLAVLGMLSFCDLGSLKSLSSRTQFLLGPFPGFPFLTNGCCALAAKSLQLEGSKLVAKPCCEAR